MAFLDWKAQPPMSVTVECEFTFSITWPIPASNLAAEFIWSCTTDWSFYESRIKTYRKKVRGKDQFEREFTRSQWVRVIPDSKDQSDSSTELLSDDLLTTGFKDLAPSKKRKRTFV